MADVASPIVVLCPMPCEYDWLAGQLEDSFEDRHGGIFCKKGTVDGYPVIVVRCLIGMVNAAIAAMLAIERYAPRCVLIQGTAGAHDPALHRGDIVLGESVVEAGRFITARFGVNEGIHYEDYAYVGVEMPEGEHVHAVRAFHGDEALLRTAAALPYAHGSVRCGTIGTADVWNRELDQIARLRKTLGTDCEEMEGFAVAQVCARFGVPTLDIRVISNSEWHPAEAFDEHTALLSQQFCLDLIRALIR